MLRHLGLLVNAMDTVNIDFCLSVSLSGYFILHLDIAQSAAFHALIVVCCCQVLEDFAAKFQAAQWTAAKEKCVKLVIDVLTIECYIAKF